MKTIVMHGRNSTRIIVRTDEMIEKDNDTVKMIDKVVDWSWRQNWHERSIDFDVVMLIDSFQDKNMLLADNRSVAIELEKIGKLELKKHKGGIENGTIRAALKRLINRGAIRFSNHIYKWTLNGKDFLFELPPNNGTAFTNEPFQTVSGFRCDLKSLAQNTVLISDRMKEIRMRKNMLMEKGSMKSGKKDLVYEPELLFDRD